MKYILVFLFLHVFSTVISQTVNGIVLSSPGNEPLNGVDLEFYLNYGENNESVFEATTDSKGKFEFNRNGVKLPSTFLVKIKKADFIDEEQHKYISINELIKINVSIDKFSTQQVVESLNNDITNIKKDVQEIKEIITEENIIVPDNMDAELKVLSDLLDSKQDTINVLKNRLSVSSYGNWEKDKTIKKLNRDIEELQSMLSKFKINLNNFIHGFEEAHLKIVNCYCEERNTDEGYVTVGFEIISAKNEYLESGYKNIRIELLKLSSVNRNSKKEKIINRETNEFYVEKNIMFPQNKRIRIPFPVNPKDIKWKSNNYYIKIYNLGYRDDVDLEEIEISNLKSECFKRNDNERNILFNTRLVYIENLIEVSNKKLFLSIFDEKPDKDIISIYLNEKPIIQNLEVTNLEKKIPLNLFASENLLIIESNSMGKNEPNTTKVKIIENDSEEIISLDSNMNTSAGIRILVKN